MCNKYWCIDEWKSTGTQWIVLYVNGIEHASKEI